MWYVIIFALVIVLDQGTKIWAAAFSGAVGNAGVSSVHLAWVIPDFIEISYCENSNGSMGLFAGIPHIQTIFKISTVVIIAAIVLWLISASVVKFAALIFLIGIVISALTTLLLTRFYLYLFLSSAKNKIAFCNFKREELEDD